MLRQTLISKEINFRKLQDNTKFHTDTLKATIYNIQEYKSIRFPNQEDKDDVYEDLTDGKKSLQQLKFLQNDIKEFITLQNTQKIKENAKYLKWFIDQFLNKHERTFKNLYKIYETLKIQTTDGEFSYTDTDFNYDELVAIKNKKIQNAGVNIDQVVNEVNRNKTQNIIQIQKDAQELAQLQFEISTKAHQDQRQIDTIQYNVEDTRLNVDKGYKEVVLASEYQNKQQSFFWRYVIIVFGILIVVCLIWYFVMKK